MATTRQNAYSQDMKALFALILAAAVSITLLTSSHADPLSPFIGEKRPLLLFSKSRSNATLDRQIDLLRDLRSELSDRDMIVLVTAGRQNTTAAIGYSRMPSSAARDLLKRFQPSKTALTLVLIGKDGQEKGRWNNVIDPQILLDLVDSMPMRQREMQDQSATN